jgi:hypothetical protein
LSPISAAALVGLGAAPLWTSKCSYLTDTGTAYAESKLVHKDVIVNRFFGIFFMFFQSGLFFIHCSVSEYIISHSTSMGKFNIISGAQTKRNSY